MRDRSMRNRSMWWGIAALLAATGLSHAGPVGPLTNFTAGTPAKAAEVNGNFSAVSTAVNDNDARITTLQSTVTPAGNIVLVPSTASAGNILKGTAPFIHNFGTSNTFIGVNAGNLTTTGVGLNTAIGVSALQSNTTGSANTASGFQALLSNTTGSENTASGSSALQSNTTGSSNTASGVNALVFNTTGSFNTASGASALFSNTTGSENTASGTGALFSNTTGSGNTASGTSALSRNTTGGSNTASGASALSFNTGNHNTGTGQLALGNNATGSFNTASGSAALLFNRTGNGNIAIGASAGSNLTTGDSNIDIGNVGVAAEANTIRIGTGGTQTATFIAGIRGVTTANANAVAVLVDSAGQLGTASSSRRVKDDIADMGKASSMLMQLRPVTFHYKSDRNPAGRTLQYGLVAEEVAKVAPGLVARSADGRIETVYYQFLAPMLLNEVQKQQRTIEAQAAELTKQTAELTKQTARIVELEKQGMEIAELKRRVAHMAWLLEERAGMIATAGR
jgi:hypothetical protein